MLWDFIVTIAKQLYLAILHPLSPAALYLPIATTTSTTLTITANETGGTITVPVTVNADTNLTAGQISQ